jgi:hypothetical protein
LKKKIIIVLSICILILILITELKNNSTSKYGTIIETTRKVKDKYMENNLYYLMLSSKSGKDEKTTISYNDWSIIEKGKYYTFIVENNVPVQLKK